MSDSEGCQNLGGRRYMCPIDQYLMTVSPTHVPRPEESLLRGVRERMGTDDTEKAWKLYLPFANQVVEQLKSQSILADKPKVGDTSVKYYDIPDSNDLAIRLWDGGMEKYGLYCFDLYDLSKRTAVNFPHDYKICQAPLGGTFVVGGIGSEVKSWEMAFGMRREAIPPGEERFAVPEGSHLALVRPGKPLFFFALPTRPRVFGGVAAVYAQPRS